MTFGVLSLAGRVADDGVDRRAPGADRAGGRLRDPAPVAHARGARRGGARLGAGARGGRGRRRAAADRGGGAPRRGDGRARRWRPRRRRRSPASSSSPSRPSRWCAASACCWSIGIVFAFVLALFAGIASLSLAARARPPTTRSPRRPAGPATSCGRSARAVGDATAGVRRAFGRLGRRASGVAIGARAAAPGARARDRRGARALRVGARHADEGRVRRAEARPAGPARARGPQRAAEGDERRRAARRHGRGRRRRDARGRDVDDATTRRRCSTGTGYSKDRGCGRADAVPGVLAARPVPHAAARRRADARRCSTPCRRTSRRA